MVIILSSLEVSSEGERVSVDAIIGRAKSMLDHLEPAGFAEDAPRPRCRTVRIHPGDLLDRSVFDERTSAEAISHGEVSCSCWWSPAGLNEGRGIGPRRRLANHLDLQRSLRQSNARQNP